MCKNICLAFMALLVGLSCFTGTDGGENQGPTTVLGLLELFEEVWNTGDLETYQTLLDEENFTFYFDPSDAEHPDIPPFWGYDEEMAAYTAIFEQAGAENVYLDLDFSGVTEPEGEIETHQVHAISYLLWVLIDKDTYKAEGQLDMQFEKVAGAWLITDWWDRASFLLLGIIETSWGALKALY